MMWIRNPSGFPPVQTDLLTVVANFYLKSLRLAFYFLANFGRENNAVQVNIELYEGVIIDR